MALNFKGIDSPPLALEFLPNQPQQLVELMLHGDHLLTHMEGHLGPLQVHSHLFDEEARHAHTIDLIQGIEPLSSPDDRADHTLPLQAKNEFLINTADFNDLCNPKVLSCHCPTLLLKMHVFTHVFGIGLVNFLDGFLRDLLLWHTNHQPQI